MSGRVGRGGQSQRAVQCGRTSRGGWEVMSGALWPLSGAFGQREETAGTQTLWEEALLGASGPLLPPFRQRRLPSPASWRRKGWAGRPHPPSIKLSSAPTRPTAGPGPGPIGGDSNLSAGGVCYGPTSILHFQCLPPFTWDWLASGCHLLSYLPPTPVSSPGKEAERPVSIFFPFRDNYHSGVIVLQLSKALALHEAVLGLLFFVFHMVPSSTSRKNSREHSQE